ncbi:MAG TPA: hypothetical protein VGO35_09885 [Gammaproteobacteria bacterium]|jgi:hypothetical protein|nr:hypothetical protein [Gammaproteobacteria bacterium]
MFDAYISTDSGSDERTAHDTDAQVTIFPCRERFEAGISRMLRATTGQCAVLHMTVRSDSLCTGSVSRRILNLAGNALRTGMHVRAAAYLGDAEYAVLLQDTDAREAAAYAQAVTALVCGARVSWDDEVLTLTACIGGVLADDCEDGAALLEMAETARAPAWGKPGCKVHMLHAPEGDTQLPKSGSATPTYSLSAI